MSIHKNQYQDSQRIKKNHNHISFLAGLILIIAFIGVSLKLSCFNNNEPTNNHNVSNETGESNSDDIITQNTTNDKPVNHDEIIQKHPSVWCFPEYYRLDAVSDEIAEYGYNPFSEDFKKKNDVYDSQTNTVTLFGLQGESVAFQIAIEGNWNSVSLEAYDMPARVNFIYEGYLQYYDEKKNTVRYIPELAIPLHWLNNSFDVNSVPAPLPFIENKKRQAIMVDVLIPRAAPAGLAKGRIVVKSGMDTISEIVVNLRILNAAIPEQPSYLMAIIQYGTFVNKLANIEQNAYRTMQEHRLSIHDIPYSSQRGWAYEDAVPKTTFSPVFERISEIRDEAKALAEKGEYELLPELEFLKDPNAHTVNSKDFDYRLKDTLPMHDAVLRACRDIYEKDGAGIVDWTNYDKRYGSLFDGSAFENGIPIASFELPFNFNWPCPLDRFDKDNPKQGEMFEAVWIKVAQDFLRHAKEKNWTRTQFYVYINPKDSNNNLSMWKGDEPCELRDFLFHQYIMGLFNRAFADKGNVKVDYKLEIGHYECDYGKCPKRNYDDKTWDESNARELLKDVEVWVPNARHYPSAIEMVKKQISEQGDRFYSYSPAPRFYESSMSIYGIAFRAMEDQSSGYFWYTPNRGDLTIWRNHPGQRISEVQNKIKDNETLHYTSDGFGKPNEFLPSMRIKSLRSVESHYSIFKLASAIQPEFGKMISDRMVKYVEKSIGSDKGMRSAIVNNNPDDLYRARMIALSIISGDASISPSGDYKGSLPNVNLQMDSFHYCANCGEACSPVKCEWCGALQK